MRGMKALIAGCAIVGGLAFGNLLGVGAAHPHSNLNPLGSVYTLNPGGGTIIFGNGAHGSIPSGGSVAGNIYRYGSGAAGNVPDTTPIASQVTFDSSSTQG
jgi:hypothetical protein